MYVIEIDVLFYSGVVLRDGKIVAQIDARPAIIQEKDLEEVCSHIENTFPNTRYSIFELRLDTIVMK